MKVAYVSKRSGAQNAHLPIINGLFWHQLFYQTDIYIYIYIYISQLSFSKGRNGRKWYQIWIGDISSGSEYFPKPFFPSSPSRFFDSSDIYFCILYSSCWFLMLKKLEIVDFEKYLQTAVLTEKFVFVRRFYFFFISFVFKIIFSYDNLWSMSIPKI